MFMTRGPRILIVALNHLLGEADQTRQGRTGQDRARTERLASSPCPLLMKKLGRSLVTAHPPPEPYAKKARQCKRGRGGAR
jgi:hypothetical protein